MLNAMWRCKKEITFYYFVAQYIWHSVLVFLDYLHTLNVIDKVNYLVVDNLTFFHSNTPDGSMRRLDTLFPLLIVFALADKKA